MGGIEGEERRRGGRVVKRVCPNWNLLVLAYLQDLERSWVEPFGHLHHLTFGLVEDKVFAHVVGQDQVHHLCRP